MSDRGECLDERMVADEPQAMWLVWSHEHGGWWKTGGWGYTDSIAFAGRFTEERAREICTNAAYGWADGLPPEVMIPLTVAYAEGGWPAIEAAIYDATQKAIAAKAEAVTR